MLHIANECVSILRTSSIHTLKFSFLKYSFFLYYLNKNFKTLFEIIAIVAGRIFIAHAYAACKLLHAYSIVYENVSIVTADLFAGSVAFGASYEQVCSRLFSPHFQLPLHSIFPTLFSILRPPLFPSRQGIVSCDFFIFLTKRQSAKKKRNQKDNQKCIELKKPAQGFSLKVKRAIVTFCCFPCFFFFFFIPVKIKIFHPCSISYYNKYILLH